MSKIKVEIDLDDIYPDDEQTISEAIKLDITRRVKDQVWQSFKNDGLEAFNNQVLKKINQDKDLKIKKQYLIYSKISKLKSHMEMI